MKTLVIVPTYNERDSIPQLIAAVRAHLPDADVLIVDDASPGSATRSRAIMITSSE